MLPPLKEGDAVKVAGPGTITGVYGMVVKVVEKTGWIIVRFRGSTRVEQYPPHWVRRI